MLDGADRSARAASGYTWTAIALHWVVALMIAAAFGLGLYMVELKLSPLKLKLFSWHKWLGVTIWLLAVLRLVWRAVHKPPALPLMPAWQRVGAHVSHVLLYVLLLAIPLSGWVYSSAAGVPVVYLGWVPLPDLVPKDKQLADVLKEVHHMLNWTLLAVVILHVAAAIKHHFIDRDAVLHRMLPVIPEPRHKP
jgi:cytochrome b561